MCGGFFELFLAKDFGASCAEVGNAVKSEIICIAAMFVGGW